jgi:CelD/BcsL family acetyltransferase involved in cellulose biosynthesis
MGYPYGDRHPLGLTSESPVADALKSAVTRIPVPYDVLIVDELLEEDANVLAAIAGQVGMRVRERASSRAPLYPISGIATPDVRFENYSRSLKQRVRRAKRKLEKEIGQSEIQISFATSENAASLIHEIAEIEKRSWKGRGGVGIFSDTNAFSFFNRTVSELARHRRVVVSRLFADQSPVAYRLSFVAGNVLYDYNFAHLPDFSRFSPGRILLDELIGFSVREGFCALDGSRGYLDAPQLLSDWTATNVYQKTLWICRATPMGLIAYFASRLRTEIKALAGRS